jgi:sugar phosphate isomerase/epimerase
MRELANYARPRNVAVLIESHGDFTGSGSLRRILESADSEHAALLWDAHHTYVASHEQPDYTYSQLGQFIRHTHLKDSVADARVEGGRRYVLTGQGEVPVKEQFEVLEKNGYKGVYCFEWEKRWHPAIEEPEVAVPHYMWVARSYLR